MKRKLVRSLFTCGNGETGKLGLGSIFSTTLFTAVHGLPADVDVVSVSCGNSHTAVATSCGTVFTFGSNLNQQLGHNTSEDVCTAREVDIPEKVVKVSTGAAFTFALTESGSLYGWGDNRHGQVGTGEADKVVLYPTKLPGIPIIASVAAGDRHALALTMEGEVLAWGANMSGQLGIELSGQRGWFQQAELRTPRINRHLLPAEIGSRAVSVAAGSGHSLVATQSSGAFGFGTNKWWQLGAAQSDVFKVPEPIPATSAVDQVACGSSASAGLERSGRLLMWGTDTQHGGLIPEDFEGAHLREPTAVSMPQLSQVSVGFGAAAGVTVHGRLVTWGWSGYSNEGTWLDKAHGALDDGSQLGHGDKLNARRPSVVQHVCLDPQRSAGTQQGSEDDSSSSSATGLEDGRVVLFGAGPEMRVESVSCGLDHMAAVIAVDEEAFNAV